MKNKHLDHFLVRSDPVHSNGRERRENSPSMAHIVYSEAGPPCLSVDTQTSGQYVEVNRTGKESGVQVLGCRVSSVPFQGSCWLSSVERLSFVFLPLLTKDSNVLFEMFRQLTHSASCQLRDLVLREFLSSCRKQLGC